MRERIRRAVQAAVMGLAVAAVGGCSELLPKASSEVESPWPDFATAEAAIRRIEPFKTTKAELKSAGIDPYAKPNITLLTYSDITLRFPVGGSVPQDKLDRGIRECLNAGKACSGYSISVRDVKRDRTGDFWLDSLSFYRQHDVRGWSFNALILMVDEIVVYTLYGGQPLIAEREINRQPLGPLQNWGDVLPGLIR
jgi:hypothetical protein